MIELRYESGCLCCKSRCLGCHTKCISYQDYRRKQEELNEILFNGKRRIYPFDKYKEDIIRRKKMFYSTQKIVDINE